MAFFSGRLGDERNLWSDELKPLKNKPEVRHYVMAPRDENIYGRARVLEYDSKNPDFAYILFIDHGDCCWVHWVRKFSMLALGKVILEN